MQTNKAFRPYEPGQTLLLPPDLNEWLPEDHMARFVGEVVGSLDLSPFFASYTDGRGAAAYHPRMMLSVLVYGYCTGVFSSRKLAQCCLENVAFRYLSGNAMPRHSALADFRRRHLPAMESLFVEVFELCRESGLISLGHVSVDGSKIKANASKHKAVSWGRLEEREEHYREIVKELLKQAESTDSAEDEEHGPDGDGGCLPEELRRAEGRLERLAKAKQALKDRARKKAEEEREKKHRKLDAISEKERETGQKHRGRRPTVPDPEAASPEKKDQYNFTDPDARIMMDGATKSFIYAYNGQIAVDADHGVIVGTYITDHANDKNELVPAIEAVAKRNAGRLPTKVSADNGYFSEDAITDQRLADVDLFVPPTGSRRKKAVPDPAEDGGDHPPPDKPPTPAQAMRQKLQTPEGKDVYKMRKAIAEGPFGIIKAAMGFRSFSHRGRRRVQGEWNLVTACYNLRKLFKASLSTVLG
jgi:transposase